MKNSVEIPQKAEDRTTILFNNLTSGYTSKGNEITFSKRYLYSHAHRIIIYNRQDIETTQASIRRWTGKENVIHTHTHTHTHTLEYHSALKRRKFWGLRYRSSGWKSALQCRRRKFNPWSGNWDPTSLRASKPVHRNRRAYSTQRGIPHDTAKILCTAARTVCRQNKIK